jgi:hypothetical protein
MSAYGVAAGLGRISQSGLQLYLDSKNTKSYPGSGATWVDLSGNARNFALSNPSYYSFETSSKSIKFSRTVAPAAENGGYADVTVAGSLASGTYLYGNHTTEIWAKINNSSPTNTEATETLSALFVYRGWHSMFYYSTSSLNYGIFNSTINEVSAPSASIGLSNTNIIIGSWFYASVVRSGNTLTTYINGISLGSSSFAAPSVNTQVSNNLRIAIGNNIGAQYTWNADCNVSVVRMYNRALSATEILQSYNVEKKRFGRT